MGKFKISCPNQVFQAKEYIEKNFATINSVRRVAEALDVSYELLRKNFSRNIGMSMECCLHRVRIEAAKRMMERDGKRTKLYTIAIEVGYTHENLFLRHWKSIVGETPTEYRSGNRRSPK